MFRIVLFLVIFGFGNLVTGFGQTSSVDPSLVKNKITVAAAANVAAVGEALKTAFLAKYPQARMDFVYGASGALTTQIQNGGPFQIFLSADVDFPKRIFDAGLAAAPPQIYARGELILFSTKARDFSHGLAVLTDPEVSQFVLANPEIAPYGRAALEALNKTGLWDSVKAKAVTAQTITQAVQFTLGATGIGFINKSALYTKDLAVYADQQGTHWVEVDPLLHSPIDQAFVVLKTAAADPTALAFAAFIAGPEARAIFLRAGYAVP